MGGPHLRAHGGSGSGRQRHRYQGARRLPAPPPAAPRPLPRHRFVSGGVVSHVRDGGAARRLPGRACSARQQDWHLDLSAVSDDDAARALLLWVNEPGNPTGSQSAAAPLGDAVAWARARGIVVASDECYVEFRDVVGDSPGRRPPRPASMACWPSTRSPNAPTWPATGRVPHRRRRARAYLGSVRTHAGIMVPGPVQAAAVAAWADDAHVAAQRAATPSARRCAVPSWSRPGSPCRCPTSFYLWSRSADPAEDAWGFTARLAVGAASSPPAISTGQLRRPRPRRLVEPLERFELGPRLACRLRRVPAPRPPPTARCP